MAVSIATVWAGTALALVALCAEAAELPTMRAPPPRHAKACRVGGMEGYYLAGSSVCVKVSGYVSGGMEIAKSPSK